MKINVTTYLVVLNENNKIGKCENDGSFLFILALCYF